MPLKFCHELCFSLPNESLHPKLAGDGQDKGEMVAQEYSWFGLAEGCEPTCGFYVYRDRAKAIAGFLF